MGVGRGEMGVLESRQKDFGPKSSVPESFTFFPALLQSSIIGQLRQLFYALDPLKPLRMVSADLGGLDC